MGLFYGKPSKIRIAISFAKRSDKFPDLFSISVHCYMVSPGTDYYKRDTILLQKRHAILSQLLLKRNMILLQFLLKSFWRPGDSPNPNPCITSLPPKASYFMACFQDNVILVYPNKQQFFLGSTLFPRPKSRVIPSFVVHLSSTSSPLLQSPTTPRGGSDRFLSFFLYTDIGSKWNNTPFVND